MNRKPRFTTFLTGNEIARRVEKVGKEISFDYRGKIPILLGVLKGSFIFLSDLARSIGNIDVEIDFIRICTYGSRDRPMRKPELSFDMETDPRGRDIILVEDIIDTGRSLEYLVKHIRGKSPASLKVCTLINKGGRREKTVNIDYSCFEIASGFLVGYGLDFSEKYRNIKDILVMEDV